MISPRITYDPDANAIYLCFSDNEIAETLEFSESVYMDVDTDGVPVGLEVLNASSSLLPGLPGVSDTATLKDLMTRDAAQVGWLRGLRSGRPRRPLLEIGGCRARAEQARQPYKPER